MMSQIPTTVINTTLQNMKTEKGFITAKMNYLNTTREFNQPLPPNKLIEYEIEILTDCKKILENGLPLLLPQILANVENITAKQNANTLYNKIITGLQEVIVLNGMNYKENSFKTALILLYGDSVRLDSYIQDILPGTIANIILRQIFNIIIKTIDRLYKIITESLVGGGEPTLVLCPSLLHRFAPVGKQNTRRRKLRKLARKSHKRHKKRTGAFRRH